MINSGYSISSDVTDAVTKTAQQMFPGGVIPVIDFCYVFYSFEGNVQETLINQFRRVFQPNEMICVPSNKLIYNNSLFDSGICVVTFSEVETRSSGFFHEEDVPEQTEKYIWRMSKGVSRMRKLFLGFSLLKEDALSEHLKGLEQSVGRRSVMLNLYNLRRENKPCHPFYFNSNAFDGGAMGTFFYDPHECVVKTGSGFNPIGRPVTIEVDKDNPRIVTRIDDVTAVDYYKKFFDDSFAADCSSCRQVFDRYPLGFKKTQYLYDIYYATKILPGGEIEFLQEIEAKKARMMIPTTDGLLTEVRSVAVQSERLSSEYNTVLFFDTINRYKFFGQHYKKQIDAIKEAAPGADFVGGLFDGFISMFDPEQPELGHGINSFGFAMVSFG